MSREFQLQKKSYSVPTLALVGLMRHRAVNEHAQETVPPSVHEVLNSPGQPLDAATRAFFEPRFGHDFGKVRVHTDMKAAQSAQAMKTLAYTTENKIVVESSKVNLTSETGLRVLAHELAHVVARRGTNEVQCWGGKDHERITYEAAKDLIPDKLFVYAVATRSSLMDFRTRRLLWTGPRFLIGQHKGVVVSVAGPIIGPALAALGTKGEGPDHGEDGNYSKRSESDAAPQNIARQNKYLMQALLHERQARTALREGKPVHKIGSASSQVFDSLGLAVHVAQDRGSHCEGTMGMGHNDPRTKDGWDPDNPAPDHNQTGYIKAVANTKELFMDWIRLSSSLK